MRAVLFPGQGCQSPGMGAWCREHSYARTLAAQVLRRTGLNVMALVTEADTETLVRTENAQPAILFVCLAALGVALDEGMTFGAAAGHSLGEYAALVAAGALDPAEAISLVCERGSAMAEAAAAADAPTGMDAVIGLDCDAVSGVTEGSGVEVANDNSPRQVVIGGPLGALEALRPRLLDAGATRVIRLQVSAAFHTRWMEPAARRLGRALESAVFADAALAVYGNVDARPESGAEALRRRLGRQLTSRVRWTECIRAMAGDGVDEFVEIGPRRTLAPLVREITPDASVQHRYSPDGPVAAAGAVAPPGGRA